MDTSSCWGPLAHECTWDRLSIVFLEVPSSTGVGCRESNLFQALWLHVILKEIWRVPDVHLGTCWSCGCAAAAFPRGLVGRRVYLEGVWGAATELETAVPAQTGHFFWHIPITACFEKNSRTANYHCNRQRSSSPLKLLKISSPVPTHSSPPRCITGMHILPNISEVQMFSAWKTAAYELQCANFNNTCY